MYSVQNNTKGLPCVEFTAVCQILPGNFDSQPYYSTVTRILYGTLYPILLLENFLESDIVHQTLYAISDIVTY
jgi:hypothetical protein